MVHSLNMALCMDMQMNGLKLSNSWAGYLILLNPPYTAATQWRFVNRAIDEVENDQVRLCVSAGALLLLQGTAPQPVWSQVPAVLLLCRNSTDTAYFQRLRPYPRVLLRRTNTRFKGSTRLSHPLALASSTQRPTPRVCWCRLQQDPHRIRHLCLCDRQVILQASARSASSLCCDQSPVDVAQQQTR